MVYEAATDAVHARAFVVVVCAQFALVLLVAVDLAQLLLSVGKLTLVTISTAPSFLERLAELRFVLGLAANLTDAAVEPDAVAGVGVAEVELLLLLLLQKLALL